MIIDALLTIFLYCAISIVTYLLAKNDFNKTSKKRPKITILTIVIISILFTILNVLTTSLSDGYGDDRTNYLLNFTNQRATPSIGLQFIIDFVKKISADFDSLLYITTFITTAIAIYAYRKSNESTPKALIYLLSTQFIFASFVNLKQCYANVLGALGIVLLLDKEKNNTIICLILITIATIFHPSAYILYIVAIMIKTRKTKNRLIFLTVLLLFTLIAFRPALSLMSAATRPIAPSLSQKIIQYTTEMDKNEIGDNGLAIIIKGIPFYLLLYVASAKRKELSNTFSNYDNYLLLIILLSSTYITSIYNGWFARLAYYLYLPASIYCAKISSVLRPKSKYKLVLKISLLLNLVLLIRYIILIYLNYGGI